MSHRSLSPAQYAAHMTATTGQLDAIPEADSPEDLTEQMKTAANNLHSNPDATISDLFRVADALGVSAADLMQMREPK